MVVTKFGKVPNYFSLGRKAAPDERDKNFLARKSLPKKASARRYRNWGDTGYWGDQGDEPECVGFGWVHYLENSPHTWGTTKTPIYNPRELYKEAQMVDEWPGENYNGTSTRAGAKVLQSKGFIKTYGWGFDLNTAVQWLLEKGPIAIGANWYEKFFFPNGKGLIEIGGAIAGGHQWLINGINLDTGLVRNKQSWRRDRYGINGRFWMKLETLERLIHEDGECCMALET